MLRKLSLFLLTAIALMLAACGGGGGGTTTNTNTSSTSLSETFDGSGVSFKYPSGWVVQTPGDSAPGTPIMLANNQNTLDAMGAASATKAESGQQVIMVIPLVGDTAKAATAAFSSPSDMLKQMGTSMAGSNGLTFGDPTETTIAGNSAAKATGTSDQGDGKIVVIKMGDAGYVMVMGVTAKGEMGNLDSTVDGLAESLTVKT